MLVMYNEPDGVSSLHLTEIDPFAAALQDDNSSGILIYDNSNSQQESYYSLELDEQGAIARLSLCRGEDCMLSPESQDEVSDESGDMPRTSYHRKGFYSY